MKYKHTFGLSPTWRGIFDKIVGCGQQIRAVGVHRIDFPIALPIRREDDSLLALINGQVRPTFVVAIRVVGLTVSEIDHIGAARVAHIDVPVSVSITGKNEAASVL